MSNMQPAPLNQPYRGSGVDRPRGVPLRLNILLYSVPDSCEKDGTTFLSGAAHCRFVLRA